MIMDEALDREFYTVKELAKLLRVSPLTIYRLASRGELPCYNIGRAKRFRRCDIEAFLNRRRSVSAEGADGHSPCEASI